MRILGGIMTTSRAVGWAVAMAGIAVLTLPASAQVLWQYPGLGDVTSTNDKDRGVRACTSLSSSASETIESCTTVINAGGAWNLSLANAYFDRAMGFRAKHDYDLEIADLDQVIRLNPQSARAYAGRGIAWNRKGDHERAFADFDHAVRLKPDLVEALLGRSTEFACRGDQDHELSDADQVISLMPRPERAYLVHVAQAYANRASAGV
jgi:cytochrome c-type biogenesis protein CcmH/NrfG